MQNNILKKIFCETNTLYIDYDCDNKTLRKIYKKNIILTPEYLRILNEHLIKDICLLVLSYVNFLPNIYIKSQHIKSKAKFSCCQEPKKIMKIQLSWKKMNLVFNNEIGCCCQHNKNPRNFQAWDYST